MAAYAFYKYNPAEMPPEELEATFIGREPLLDRLVSAVREQTEADSIQHYILLGPRGIGKTTLLLMLRRRIKTDPDLARRWFVVQYREEEFYAHTLRDLLALALEFLAAEENVSEAEAVYARAEAEPEDEKSLAIILDGLRGIARFHRKRILLLVDNLDRVFPRRSGSDINERAFRKLLTSENFVMVVGTSVKLFEEIAAYDEALFNFFSPVPIDPLKEEEVEAQLLARARADGNHEFLREYPQHKHKIRSITYLTGGNPRLVLMLYEILCERRLHPVVATLRETMDNLTPLLKHVLEDLPPQQSKTLDALMRLGGVASPSEIARQARLRLNAVSTYLGRLKAAGFVEVEGGGRGRPAVWRVRDPMFRTWYQMRYLRPARRRVELFVEFLRAWFTVEERLTAFDELRAEFDRMVEAGLAHRARETALRMEYLAASIEDGDLRREYIGRTADAYVAAGELREAALSLAGARAPDFPPHARYEASGYAALGGRLLEKGDPAKARDAFLEALGADSADPYARLGLGVALGLLGEHEGALRAFTSVVENPQADSALRAAALVNRGVVRHKRGDIEGAITDYTAVIDLSGAPVEDVAKALFNRGVLHGNAGDHEGALHDFNTALALQGVPDDLRYGILGGRALAREHIGDIDSALADYRQCVENSGAAEVVYRAAGRLIDLLCRERRIEEAVRWMERLVDVEPEDAAPDQRLEARMGIITRAATRSVETARVLLDAALRTADPDLKARLAFLEPALAFAGTGDGEVLARLPEEEQRIARDIAAAIHGRHRSPPARE